MADDEDYNIDNMDFHGALERLRTIADDLESGELSLETAMEEYEKGMKLIQKCEEKLEDAELLIEEVDDSNPDNPKFTETEHSE